MIKMTKSPDRSVSENATPADLEELLDTHGPDLTLWPDASDVDRARKAALNDRQFRSKLDAATKLAQHLAVISEELDDHPMLDAAAGKIELSLMAHAERRGPVRQVFSSTTLVRLAATILIACAVGAGVGHYAEGSLTGGTEMSDDVLYGLMDVPFESLAAI